jgi:hypothetical protein
LSKRKKKSKDDTVVNVVDAKVVFVKNGSVIEPDLTAKVKDFIFQVIEKVERIFAWRYDTLYNDTQRIMTLKIMKSSQ